MKKIAPLLSLALCLHLSACLHYQYMPNSHNQPMLTSRGEQRWMGGLTSQNFLQSGDIQYARAISNQYIVQTNGFWTNAKQDDSRLRGGMLEVAAGRFWYRPSSLAEVGQPDGLVLELYGGVSHGRYYNKYRDGASPTFFFPSPTTTVLEGESNVNSLRLSAQPMIGYVNQVLELGLSTRLAYLHVGGTFTGNDPEAKEIYRYLLNKNKFFLFEPAATLRVGFKNFKIQGQIGYSTIPEIIGSKFYISWGMTYTIRK